MGGNLAVMIFIDWLMIMHTQTLSILFTHIFSGWQNQDARATQFSVHYIGAFHVASINNTVMNCTSKNCFLKEYLPMCPLA